MTNNANFMRKEKVFFGKVEFMVRKKFIFQKQTFVSGACTYI